MTECAFSLCLYLSLSLSLCLSVCLSLSLCQLICCYRSRTVSAAPSPTTSQRVSHSGSQLVVWRAADRISAFLVHVYITTRLISEYHRKYTSGDSVQAKFRHQEVRGLGEHTWCAVHEFCRLQLSTAPNYAAIENLGLIPCALTVQDRDSQDRF